MTFQERVFKVVKKIPRGRVATYKEVARALDSRAYRAVGQALKRNDRPIEIPCHRVIRSDGGLGGYSGKLHGEKKALLLRKDGVRVRKGKIELEIFAHKF